MTKPRPVGRPPRAKSAAVIRISIRVTEAERARYIAAAARRGVTLGHWLRSAASLALGRG